MTRSRTAALAAAIAIGWMALVTARPASAAAVVLSPGATVEGKTIGQWTADWWNWAASVPDNVFDDATGAQATANQSGPVFFVAGTGGGAAVSRSFDIPAGKHVLFPLVNWIVFNGPDPGFTSTAEEAEALTTGTVDPAQLVAEIDGQPVPNLAAHRERSPINFTFTPSSDNGAFPPGTYTDANSDGYWLMLAPLEPGQHTLHFGGTTRDYTGPDPAVTVPSFTVDVTDTVRVAQATVIPLPSAIVAGMPVLAGALAFALRRRAN